MSVIANYKLKLDVDRDESYALTLPVTKLSWSNGMQDSYDKVANVTQLQAEISNADGVLTSEVFRDYPTSERVETLGGERLANNSFSGLTGWSTFGNGTAVQVGSGQDHTGGGTGAANLRCTAAKDLDLYQLGVFELFKTYEITVVVSYIEGSYLSVCAVPGVNRGAGVTEIFSTTTTGTFTFRYEAAAASGLYLYIFNESFSNVEVTVDSVSVKEVQVSYYDTPITATPDEVTGDNVILNPEFNNWTAGVPDNWSKTGTSTQVDSGEDHTGSGVGSVNIYDNTTPGGINVAVIQPTDSPDLGRSKYRLEVKVSYLGTGTFLIGGSGTGEFHIIATGTYVWYFDHSAAFAEEPTSFTGKNFTGAVDFTLDYVRVYPVSLVVPPNNLTQAGRGMLVKVVMEYMELSQQVWIGKISQFTPTPNQNGDRLINMICLDPMDEMREADFQPSYVEDATVDELLTDMLKSFPVVTFPYASDYWIAGVPGASELGLTTYPYDGPPMNFGVGVAVIPFSGDNSDRATPGTTDTKDLVKEGVSQLGFIRDCMDVEIDGRFWWDGRNSEFRFQNRHYDYLSPAPTLTLSNFTSGEFIGADAVYNQITVHYQPRKVGAASSILYQHPSEIRISPSSVVTINAKYNDPDIPSARVGGKDMLQPVPGTDVTAFSLTGGGGESRLSDLNVSVNFFGQSAKIVLRNTSTVSEIFVPLLRLLGTPITTYTPASVLVINGDSVRLNDPQPLDYQGTLISSDSDAQDVATFLSTRYERSVRRFRAVTFLAQTSDSLMRATIQYGIGQRVRVTDSFLKHKQVYTIVGEQHNVDFQTWQHFVTWILKPSSNLNYWLLGDPEHSVLGVSTYPVF